MARAVTVQRGGESYRVSGRAAALAYQVAKAAEQIGSFEQGAVTFHCAGRKVVMRIEESSRPIYSDEFCDDDELPTA